MPDDSCAAIVLAAGASTRLGQPKQLLQIEEESLLRRSTRLAIEAGLSPVLVVLGSNAEQFESELRDLDVRIICNTEWETGMASSLKLGLSAVLTEHPEIPNLLMMVCDQPKLTLQVLNDLLKKHRSCNALITASRYAATYGVPAIFSQAVFPELAGLQGDEGARRVIARHQTQLKSVDFSGGRDDIDTPADLRYIGL